MWVVKIGPTPPWPCFHRAYLGWTPWTRPQLRNTRRKMWGNKKKGVLKLELKLCQKRMYWLVVYLPLWKIWVRQLGLLFPIWKSCTTKKMVENPTKSWDKQTIYQPELKLSQEHVPHFGEDFLVFHWPEMLAYLGSFPESWRHDSGEVTTWCHDLNYPKCIYLYIYQHTYHQHNQNLKWFRSISPCLR